MMAKCPASTARHRHVSLLVPGLPFCNVALVHMGTIAVRASPSAGLLLAALRAAPGTRSGFRHTVTIPDAGRVPRHAESAMADAFFPPSCLLARHRRVSLLVSGPPVCKCAQVHNGTIAVRASPPGLACAGVRPFGGRRRPCVAGASRASGRGTSGAALRAAFDHASGGSNRQHGWVERN